MLKWLLPVVLCFVALRTEGHVVAKHHHAGLLSMAPQHEPEQHLTSKTDTKHVTRQLEEGGEDEIFAGKLQKYGQRAGLNPAQLRSFINQYFVYAEGVVSKLRTEHAGFQFSFAYAAKEADTWWFGGYAEMAAHELDRHGLLGLFEMKSWLDYPFNPNHNGGGGGFCTGGCDGGRGGKYSHPGFEMIESLMRALYEVRAYDNYAQEALGLALHEDLDLTIVVKIQRKAFDYLVSKLTNDDGILSDYVKWTKDFAGSAGIHESASAPSECSRRPSAMGFLYSYTAKYSGQRLENLRDKLGVHNQGRLGDDPWSDGFGMFVDSFRARISSRLSSNA